MIKDGWREVLKPYQLAVRRPAEIFAAEYIPLQEVFDPACEKSPPEHRSYDGINPNLGGFM